MKPRTNFDTIKRILYLIMIAGGIATFSTNLNGQATFDDSKDRKEMAAEHIRDLAEFRVKFATEFATLPKVTLKENSKQFYTESHKLSLEAREAFTKNNLDEAEEKMRVSLGLGEDMFARRDFALILLEEKKFLEALPHCVDVALVDHNVVAESRVAPVEEFTLPMPMLTYVLAQVGDLRQATLVYNYTRNKLEKDIKRNISHFPSSKKSDSMTIGEKLRLPLPPLAVDPDKADRKSLIENNRILFLIIIELYYDKSVQSERLYDSILPNRLAFQMIEEAYAANSESANLTFYKGYSEISKEMPSQEAKVDSIKKAQAWFRSAAAKAGINSPLGKLSAEYIADSEKLRIILEKLIQDRKDNP